jgi:hypothetical protein
MKRQESQLLREVTMMSAEELERQLADEQIVPLAVGEWEALAGTFEEIARHHTMVAGDLVVVRTRAGLAAVERPTPDERVVRLLGDEATAQSFVEHRMAQYERMWDGCGCRVDYYA